MYDDIGQLRNKLGISQIQLAQYVQTSDASISMAELNARSLPTKALIHLALLEIAIISVDEYPLPIITPTVLPSVFATGEIEIAQCVSWYKRMDASLQRKLRTLEKPSAKAQQSLNYLYALQQVLPVVEAYQHQCLQQSKPT